MKLSNISSHSYTVFSSLAMYSGFMCVWLIPHLSYCELNYSKHWCADNLYMLIEFPLGKFLGMGRLGRRVHLFSNP